MIWINIIYYVISAIIGVIATGIPFIIKMRKVLLDCKSAKTAAEKEKAEADAEKANVALLAAAKQFITAAEIAFEGFDKMMKAQGSSAGAMKKDNVFTKLQAYALQNGYEFDVDVWSKKIDELVAYTKSVNTTK